jgi:methylmalonyl-CoA/ethylmalonyl-CoA epimerase
MISRIDHVSIAVKDKEKAALFFQKVFGAIPGAGAGDDHMKYYWKMFSLGDLSRLEIINPTGKGSFLAGFLERKRDGAVHHITLETPDIDAFRKALDENNIPYFGYNDFGDVGKELFIHPKHAFGVLIQIGQFNPDDWLSEEVKFPVGERWSVEKNKTGCCLTVANPGGGKISLQFTDAEIHQLRKDLE